VTEPSFYEAKIATEDLQRHESPGIEQIPVDMIKLRCLLSEIHKLTNSI